MKATGRALAGVVIAALATFGYFPFWAKSVRFGALDWPCWLLIALGIAIAARAVLRPPSGTTRADRLVAGLCLALAAGIGGMFGVYTLGISYALPEPAAGALDPGRGWPDVELLDSSGASVNLRAESAAGQLAGRKVVLSLFRGHW